MKVRAAIAISLLIVMTGCASTDEYVDDVNAIQERVTEASNSVGADINASKKEIVISLQRAHSETEEAVDDLESVDVPDDARKGHERLVEGFEDLEKLFADVRKQVESQSGGSAFDRLRSEGARVDKEIDAALEQINEELGLN